MKMICISDEKWYFKYRYFRRFFWSKKKNLLNKGPKKDDVLTVDSEGWDEGEKYYRFVEWPGSAYAAKYFAPLEESTTDIKEVTFSEIKKEVPVSAN